MKQETHHRWDSERELYDDVVYVRYEMKKEKKTINIPQHT